MSKASKTAQGVLTGQSPVRSTANIAKRNFMKNDLDCDDDDDDSGGTESYSIQPSVALWKAIDFKSKTKQTPNSMDPTQVGMGQHSSKHNLMLSTSTTNISTKLKNSFTNNSIGLDGSSSGSNGASYSPAAAPSFVSGKDRVGSQSFAMRLQQTTGSTSAPSSPATAAVTRLLSRDNSKVGLVSLSSTLGSSKSIRTGTGTGAGAGGDFNNSSSSSIYSGGGGASGAAANSNSNNSITNSASNTPPLTMSLSPVRREDFIINSNDAEHAAVTTTVSSSSGNDIDFATSLTGTRAVLLSATGRVNSKLQKLVSASSNSSLKSATTTPILSPNGMGPVRADMFASGTATPNPDTDADTDADAIATTRSALMTNKVSLTGADSVLLTGNTSVSGLPSESARTSLGNTPLISHTPVLSPVELQAKEQAEAAALGETLHAAEEVGRLQEQERSAEQARRERDDLRAQLEVMALQNQLMASRMERSQEEARLERERERAERAALLASLEKENQLLSVQLVQTERRAEAELVKEKVRLREALLQMEREKHALQEQVHATESKAAQEQAALQQQRDEYKQHLLVMEEQRKSLVLELKEREIEQQSAGAEASEKIEQQKAELLARVAALEGEKGALTADLAQSEQLARAQQYSIENQLETERSALQASLARMEDEKAALSAHLVETERAAAEVVLQASLQLTKEKQTLEENLAQIQSEKEELAVMLKRKESQVALASAQAQEQLMKERDQVASLMESITKQKEELAAQLAQVEASQQVRVEAQAQQAAKERDELRATVQRMKEELAAERQRAQEQLAEALQARQSGKLTPSKSLFDLMASNETTVGVGSPGGSGMKRTASKTVNRPLPHDISAIQEGAGETEAEGDTSATSGGNFMDYDSEAEGDAHIADREKFANLPAPHAAAAAGDLQRLMMLSGVELSLLCSYDSAHRSPLFYSVAYDNKEVVDFLLEKFPEMAGVPDEHGDTPLHAAVSADSIDNVQALLATMAGKGSEDYSQPANHMLMTPVHLTASVECLDLLYQNGASLTAVDNHGRSPLFVACAMNRWACAEYLIEGLDQEIGSLYIQDDRGDTPLHAAACNGAVDCVLLMLQYGVDPTVTNTKGLKAIDLAIRNKHKKCQQLLAEYHLHYCTSSDFDSVLFLATLEGHKQAKDRYEIVRKQMKTTNSAGGAGGIDAEESNNGGSNLGGGAGAGVPLPKTLKDTKSVFSLRKNKTMRLQRWGAWISYEDPETKQNYWYNQSTSSGQWEVPAEVAALQAQLKTVPKAPALPKGVSASFANLEEAKTLKHAKQSMRLKKIGDWIHYITEGGQPFYYNEKNGEFQWESPFGIGGGGIGSGGGSGSSLRTKLSTHAMLPRKTSNNMTVSATGSATVSTNVTPDKKKETTAVSTSGNSNSNSNSTSNSNSNIHQSSEGVVEADSAATATATATTDVTGEEFPVDQEWRPYKDPDSGALFWYNSVTGVSQWECPYDNPHAEEEEEEGVDADEGGEGEGIDEHHDAAVCHDENDLGI